MALSRRFFLVGLGGLLAAPAIVKAESLMPVKLFELEPEMEAWEGLLTPAVIAREAMRLFEQNMKVLSLSAGIPSQFTQSYIDHHYSSQDRTLPLADFSKRILEPSMAILAQRARTKGGWVSGDPLSKPECVMEAELVKGRSGAAMRFLSDYDIRTDSIVSRFDIKHG